MSHKLALPPAQVVLEGRRLLWRDTSVLLVAIAIIGAIIILLGAPGGAGPGSRTPSPEASAPPATTLPGSGGAAACPGAGGRARRRLLYFRHPGSPPMKDPGRSGIYLALFSEVGLVLLVTILGGTLGGYWVDRELDTVPVFVLVGLAIGMACGAVAVNRLISGFLRRFD